MNTRLTALVGSAGCAAKAGPSLLATIQTLLDTQGRLPSPTSWDDAAVFAAPLKGQIVATIDVITAIVDDPLIFGRIAANHSMTDVFAVGGDVLVALSVLGFPVDLDPSIALDIIEGASGAVNEIGAAIVGGHTLYDPEPKFGLSVIGIVEPANLLSKKGGRAGDALYITKPIGTGLITTAAKFDEARESDLDQAIRTMTMSSIAVARCVRGVATAATDISGFGLVGHIMEVAAACNAGAVIEAHLIPVLPGALQYASNGIVTGGGMRNTNFYESMVTVDGPVASPLLTLLHDPQTAGGLLFAVSRDREEELHWKLSTANLEVWPVGFLASDRGLTIRG